MELPSDDDGLQLPNDDDGGGVLLPSDDDGRDIAQERCPKTRSASGYCWDSLGQSFIVTRHLWRSTAWACQMTMTWMNKAFP